MSARQRHAEDGVGAQARFVGRAVELAHLAVDGFLLGRRHADERRRDDLVHMADCFAHALAGVVGRIAVAQFERFVLAGARSRRHDSAAQCAAGRVDLDLDGRLPAAVENLAGMNAGDAVGHWIPRASVLHSLLGVCNNLSV